MKNEELIKGFSPLEGIGFRRRGLRWTRVLPQLGQMVELQKSRFGPLWYVNLAGWPPSQPPPSNSQSAAMHTRFQAVELEVLLSERDAGPPDRAAIAAQVDGVLVPLMETLVLPVAWARSHDHLGFWRAGVDPKWRAWFDRACLEP